MSTKLLTEYRNHANIRLGRRLSLNTCVLMPELFQLSVFGPHFTTERGKSVIHFSFFTTRLATLQGDCVSVGRRRCQEWFVHVISVVFWYIAWIIIRFGRAKEKPSADISYLLLLKNSGAGSFHSTDLSTHRHQNYILVCLHDKCIAEGFGI